MRARRYFRGGAVAHYVWVSGGTATASAACGRRSDRWLGGTPRTRSHAASLPRCRDCVSDSGEDW